VALSHCHDGDEAAAHHHHRNHGQQHAQGGADFHF